MYLSTPDPKNHNSEIYFASDLSRALRFSNDYRSDLASDAIFELAEKSINKIIEENDISYLSFDVFDTALLRAPLCEARRFYEVSNLFAGEGKKFTVEDAFLSRILAAKACYALANPAEDQTREGQFSVIAEIVCRELQVPERISEYIALELDYERSHLVANPLILKIVDRFRHIPVIFISDMYLDSRCIEHLLEKDFGAVTVYSSGDGKGSKRSGGLFEYVAAERKIGLPNLLHFGDSLEGDYRSMKRRGGHSIYLPIPDAERTARQNCYTLLTNELAATGLTLTSVLQFNC